MPRGKRTLIVVGAGVVVASVLALIYREEIIEVVKKVGPKGVRNNNPGNIRIDSSQWQGMVPLNQNTDGAFHQFVDMAHGMRAHMKVLQAYQQKHGLDTIRKIVRRWAPYGDGKNNPDNYANFVAKEVGISPDAPINIIANTEVLAKVAHAMAIQENGWQWEAALSLDQYRRATRMLAGLGTTHTKSLLA